MFFKSAGQRTQTQSTKAREVKPAVVALEDRALLSPVPFASGSLPKAQAYVSSVYNKLLGREADPASLTNLSTALQTGATTPKNIVSSIQKSAEYRANQVTSLYWNTLERAPDQAGLAAGVKHLSTGGSVNSLMNKLVSSKEFVVKAGGTSESFVNRLYAVALNRKPDLAAKVHIDNLNSGVPASQFASLVINSKEAAGVAVANLYGNFLRRNTDNAAANYATKISQTQGAAYDQVIATLAGSNEFITRATEGK
jgi:hypothetical protein